MNLQFSIRKIFKSFRFAFSGLRILLKEEPNARIHVIACVFAVAAGVALKISTFEWIAIIFACGLVITAEIINTSIENIADFVSSEKHHQIKKVKDLAAASVLVAAIAAFVIGVIIFLPKVFILLR
ncbi:diacylglycerol kinase [Maribellus sediminis]|uniref:diacylglycerol kinase n=1 Tax=Maribellus sediminis TaxID=2696285 RepID=UPI0014318043|nr:diacylglycerol kinase family protein [Maribellus sediminis]